MHAASPCWLWIFTSPCTGGSDGSLGVEGSWMIGSKLKKGGNYVYCAVVASRNSVLSFKGARSVICESISSCCSHLSGGKSQWLQ